MHADNVSRGRANQMLSSARLNTEPLDIALSPCIDRLLTAQLARRSSCRGHGFPAAGGSLCQVGASKFSAGSSQMSSAYSRIVRSDENQPMRATFSMLEDVQPGVAHCPSMLRWVR